MLGEWGPHGDFLAARPCSPTVNLSEGTVLLGGLLLLLTPAKYAVLISSVARAVLPVLPVVMIAGFIKMVTVAELTLVETCFGRPYYRQVTRSMAEVRESIFRVGRGSPN